MPGHGWRRVRRNSYPVQRDRSPLGKVASARERRRHRCNRQQRCPLALLSTGSSEFHAWGDSNLYLRRDNDDRIFLTAEHRAAAAMPSVTLELAERDSALALQRIETNPQTERRIEPASVDQRITAVLTESGRPRPFSEQRASCRIRATTLYQRLAAMTAAGIIVKSADGYRLTTP